MTGDARRLLLTIGHSDHDAGSFVALLARNGVSAVADVRSQPYSRIHAQFNRESLGAVLKRAGIQYVFLGAELGARRTERECYNDGKARYDLICRLPAFQDGLNRIRRGLTTQRIVLLCAEKDPITCHRMVLICRCLRDDAVEIGHIREDGSIESTEQAESRLLEAVGLPAEDLFRDRRSLVDEAYDRQGERIAYVESGPAVLAGELA